jgi:hypothetical protein
MKMRGLIKVGLAGFMFSAVASANAFMWTFNDALLGSEEVPPTGSTVTGTISGTYDDVANMLMINAVAGPFSTATNGAHIHNAAFGVNGPIIFNLGGTGGTSYNTSNMFTLTAAQETELLANRYYVNVHTQTFPGGEIRGQLNPVPEPATMLALAGGAAALVARRRRRK